MNNDLLSLNRIIRKNSLFNYADNDYSYYESDKTFQINFKSLGCKNYFNGSCIMCNYGKGKNLTPDEILAALDNAILKSTKPIRTLLIGSYGSMLDEFEISMSSLKTLINRIKELDISTLIIETHYETISKEKLEYIKTELSNINILMELGFESANLEVREKCLLKNINNEKFIKTIELIHSLDMGVILNLLVGIPFLTPKEQIEDTLNSINWGIENNVDEFVLFPINIKLNTLLYQLYQNNEYRPISHWQLIEILNKVNPEYLDLIYLAWYGNRGLEYGNILPFACGICKDEIMNFYDKFLSEKTSNRRKELLNKLLLEKQCNCYEEMLQSLEIIDAESLDNRIVSVTKKLKLRNEK